MELTVPHHSTNHPPASTSPGGEIDLTRLSSELFEAMAYLENKDEFRRFMMDLCTPAELRALAGRWYIARVLERGGTSYRDLSAETGISTTTIGRVSRFLNEEPHQGYRLVLDRMNGKSK